MACGGQHTIAVTDRDDVYGFGSDRHGQLGLGQGSVASPIPARCRRLLRLVRPFRVILLHCCIAGLMGCCPLPGSFVRFVLVVFAVVVTVFLGLVFFVYFLCLFLLRQMGEQ